MKTTARRYWKVSNMQKSYTTHAKPKKKTHAFVLRGLENGIDIRRMKEDLTASYKIIPRQIYRPLYLVVSEPAVTLKYLN